MALTITFLGAAGTVTGSKYLVTTSQGPILIDCGMFQGERSWRVRNWDQPTFDLAGIKCVLLTHAHVDHIGMLPRFFKLGMNCPVLCSPPTAEIGRIILLDSARLQEEETLFRLESGKSRHSPPLPLYTEADAQGVLELFKTTPVNARVEVLPGVFATWRLMGHILGACSITLEADGKKIVFSGDIGRYSVPILVDPTPCDMGDLLLIESTYGDRLHAPEAPLDTLAGIITSTAQRGGAVVIPSFAVGRTQTLLYYLRELKSARRIPDVPIIVDSPMASDATAIYRRHSQEYDEQARKLLSMGEQPFTTSKLLFTRDRNDSIKLNKIHEPMIIVSASGMLTGGRILHHLRHRITDERNTILFVGFQPPGSRGDWIKSGAKTCRILGDDVPVNAQISEISGLSAHADRDELLRWCRSCTGKPGKVAVVHGEPPAAASFAQNLRTEFGWDASAAQFQSVIEI